MKKKRILKDPQTGEIVGATRTPFSHKAKELNKQIFAEKFEKRRLEKEVVPKQGNLGKNLIFLTLFFFLISISIWIWLSEDKGSVANDDPGPPSLKPASGLEPKKALVENVVDPDDSEKELPLADQTLLRERLQEVESRLKSVRTLEEQLKEQLQNNSKQRSVSAVDGNTLGQRVSPKTDSSVNRSVETVLPESYPKEIKVNRYPRGQMKSKIVQFSEVGPFERWDYFENNIVREYCKSATLKGLDRGPFEGHRYGNFENGRSRFSQYFADGKANGSDRTWFENGKPKYEGHWKNDLKDGKWSYWWSNGNPLEERYWKMGVPKGIWKQWYDDSRIKEQLKYSPSGKLIASQTWKDGYLKELYFDISVFDKNRESVFNDWFREEMKKNPTPPFRGISIVRSRGYQVKALHDNGSLLSARRSLKSKDFLELELRKIFDYHHQHPRVDFEDEKWLLYIGG